jgi:hypothetical protein
MAKVGIQSGIKIPRIVSFFFFVYACTTNARTPIALAVELM